MIRTSALRVLMGAAIALSLAATTAACVGGGVAGSGASAGSAGNAPGSAGNGAGSAAASTTDQTGSMPSAQSVAAALSSQGAPTTTTTAGCIAGARACPIRLTFASGAYSAQAHGNLTGIHSELWFVVHARSGQAMVALVEGAGPTRGIVIFPGGKSVGQPGGRIFDGILPSTGDYLIQVTESTMGEAWSGRADVVALIY